MTVFTGGFTCPGTSAEINLVLEVTVSSQDIALNQTTLAWNFYMDEYVNASPYNNSPTSSASATAGNLVFSSGTLSYNFNLTNEDIPIGSGTTTVTHNSDGTLTIPISASYNGGSPIGTASISDTMVLPTIPRASTPSFSPAFVDAGDTVTINTNRSDSSFTHTIEYSLGASSGTIGTGIGASTTWAPPLSLLNEFPNSIGGFVTITTTTFLGASQIGSPTNKTLYVTAPASVVPDFTTVTHSENVSAVSTVMGGTTNYVQTLSKLNLAITGAVGAYGSTITAYKIEVDGQTINAVSGVTPAVLATPGTYNITGTVTDSRYRQKAKTVSITVLPYAGPAIDAGAFSVGRALSDGTPDDDGTYIRVDLDAAVQSLLVAAVEKNAIHYKISTRLRGDVSWTLKDTVTPGGVVFDSYDTVSTYAVEDSFDVLIEVYDNFQSTFIQGSVATAVIFMHWDAAVGVGIGKYREDGMLDVAGDIYQNGLPVIDTSDLATTSVAGIQENATSAEAAAGTANNRTITPDVLPDAIQAYTAIKNYVVNPRFRVNQMGSTSGTALSLGAYFCDVWKANSAPGTNSVTFTGSDAAGRVVTTPGRLVQVIEGSKLVSGDYILLWGGTADGSLDGSAFGASGIVATLTAGTNVTIEFQDGTLEWVALLRADQWSGYVPDNGYAEDLREVMRYYYRITVNASGSSPFGAGVMSSNTNCSVLVYLPVQMRAVPTLAGTAAGSLQVRTATTLTASAYALGGNSTNQICTVDVTTSTGVAGQIGLWRGSASGHYMEFMARL